jgi:hypothetical protein
MSKLGKRLIQAAREGRAIARGEADPATYRIHVPAEVNVRRIRPQLGLSQDEFAARFGLSVATVHGCWRNLRRVAGSELGSGRSLETPSIGSLFFNYRAVEVNARRERD